MRRRSAAAALAALVLLAGCTSSGSPHRAGTPTARARSSSSSAPFQRVDGAVLALGGDLRTTQLYLVTASGLQQLTRLTSGVSVESVAENASRLVLGLHSHKRGDWIAELSGTSLTDLETHQASGPALSAGGALAWAGLGSSGSTPGITKPRGFTVTVRATQDADPQVVYTTQRSTASPQWIGSHALVVAASDQSSTQLVRIDTRSGRTKVVATIDRPAVLAVVANATRAALTDQNGVSTLVTLDGHAQAPLPTGWRPLCWLPHGLLLSAREGELGTIAVVHDRPRTPVVIGTPISGLSAVAAACARVRG